MDLQDSLTKRQQNPTFPNNMAGYLEYWSKRPTVLLMAGSLLMLLVMLFMAGGLLFWVSQFNTVFADQRSNQGELELARSGLQTMKRMVGDQEAWSESIKEEYNNIFLANIIKAQSVDYSHSENFVRSNY